MVNGSVNKVTQAHTTMAINIITTANIVLLRPKNFEKVQECAVCCEISHFSEIMENLIEQPVTDIVAFSAHLQTSYLRGSNNKSLNNSVMI